MELFHKTCGGEVFVDITKMFSIQTRIENPSISTKSVNVKGLRLDVTLDKLYTIEFVCSKCGETHIKFEHVLVNCYFCGHDIPIEKSFISEPYGVVICGSETCKKEIIKRSSSSVKFIPTLDVIKVIRI